MENTNDIIIAKEMGFRDYKAGCPLITNPYKLYKLRLSYTNGWLEAEKEYLVRVRENKKPKLYIVKS